MDGTSNSRLLPLLTHLEAGAPVAWHGGRAVPVRELLRLAHALSARLPASPYALNLCSNRYYFVLAFIASVLRGQCTLLPGAYAPELIRRLQTLTPDLFCFIDGEATRERLPELSGAVFQIDQLLDELRGERIPNIPSVPSIPRIAADQIVARVFTSGSTGTPVPHLKRWGELVRSVRIEAERLLPERGGWAFVGTVPPQHMYGFESTVLLPLQSGGLLSGLRPFFPADIVAALEPLPRPRALVSTPVHLRTLVDSGTVLPALDLIVCATAMLPASLARELEHRYAAPLLEIYGSTETGQIASRRPVAEDAWQLWPGVELAFRDGACWALGGHLPEPTPLADVITPVGPGRFLLEGRTADLVNIAGKRSSLAYLSHHLTAIPGVVDGAFFLHDDARASVAGVTRLAAAAVAPGLDAARITAALRERIDPVFLPRPLLLVDRLPRNETGKLPQERLRTLIAQAAATCSELISTSDFIGSTEAS